MNIEKRTQKTDFQINVGDVALITEMVDRLSVRRPRPYLIVGMNEKCIFTCPVNTIFTDEIPIITHEDNNEHFSYVNLKIFKTYNIEYIKPYIKFMFKVQRDVFDILQRKLLQQTFFQTDRTIESDLRKYIESVNKYINENKISVHGERPMVTNKPALVIDISVDKNTPQKVVVEESKSFTSSGNSVFDFVKMSLEQDRTSKIETKEMYDTYTNFCTQMRMECMNENRFAFYLKMLKVYQKVEGKKTYYTGFRFKEQSTHNPSGNTSDSSSGTSEGGGNEIDRSKPDDEKISRTYDRNTGIYPVMSKSEIAMLRSKLSEILDVIDIKTLRRRLDTYKEWEIIPFMQAVDKYGAINTSKAMQCSYRTVYNRYHAFMRLHPLLRW